MQSSNANNIYTKLLPPVFHFESGFVKRPMQSKEIELQMQFRLFFFINVFFLNLDIFTYTLPFQNLFQSKFYFFFIIKRCFVLHRNYVTNRFLFSRYNNLKTNCTIFYSFFILLTICHINHPKCIPNHFVEFFTIPRSYVIVC